MDQALPVCVTVVAVFSVCAAVFDIWKFRVPNWLTASMLLTGVAYHALQAGVAGLLLSASGIVVGFAILFLLYVVGGVGAGDVKLLAATGAWLGPVPTLLVVAVAGLATGLYSFLVLAWSGGLNRFVITMQVLVLQLQSVGKYLGTSERVESVVKQPDRRMRLVPFAAMVALGVVLLVIWRSYFVRA